MATSDDSYLLPRKRCSVGPAGESRFSENGETYYFCTASCKANFDRDSGNYVRAGAKREHEGQ